MKRILLGTTALAFAGAMGAGQVSAADKLSVGVSGFMEQWVGMNNLDGADNGGVSQMSDSEIHFKGKLEADSGLTFSIKVEMEANSQGIGKDANGDDIDESQATISGSFGQVVLGTEDHPAALMHHGNQDVGIGYCADAPYWIGATGCARESGKGLGTNGWLIGGDDQKIGYYTPRISGVQFGAAYVPDANSEDINRSPTNNDQDAWSIGLNAKQDIGDANVTVSFGHYQRSQVGAHTLYTISSAEVMEHKSAIAVYQEAIADGVANNVPPTTPAALNALAEGAAAAKADLAANMSMSTKADSQTFSNFGLQVGFGGIGFHVAHATVDGGVYMVVPGDLDDDPNASDVLVKDTSKDYDVTSVGGKYSDGPMALSLTHMLADADDGGEANVTMLSMSYTLAPGIASKTSLVSGEQDGAAGTVFVTGITLGF